MSLFLTKFAGDQLAWDIDFQHELPAGSGLVSGVASAIDLNDLSDATAVVVDHPNIVINGAVGRMRIKGGVPGRLYRITMSMTLDTTGQVADTLQEDIILRIRR